jgi:hypothetical protein
LQKDLIDELQLFVSPVSIGEGSRLFGSDEEMLDRFKISETLKFALGGSRLKLEPGRALAQAADQPGNPLKPIAFSTESKIGDIECRK